MSITGSLLDPTFLDLQVQPGRQARRRHGIREPQEWPDTANLTRTAVDPLLEFVHGGIGGAVIAAVLGSIAGRAAKLPDQQPLWAMCVQHALEPAAAGVS
jgi:hypothetical protein